MSEPGTMSKDSSPARSRSHDACSSSKNARPDDEAKSVPPETEATSRRTLPLLLWPPNLIGYVRVLTLVAAMRASDPTGAFALWMLTASLVLDYFDGPCARHMNMCSQFGDLLDHYTDHATMMWLVYITAGSMSLWGSANLAISAIHNGVAFVYMAVKGHYFKHSVAHAKHIQLRHMRAVHATPRG